MSTDPVSHDVPAGSVISPARFEAVLSSISDGVFTIDAEGLITCFNRAAEEITGFTRAQAIGRPCHEIFRANICGEACALRYTIETGKPVMNLMVHITNADGVRVPVSISTSLFRNEQGKLDGGVETFRDLGQVEHLRKALEHTYTYGDIITKSHSMRRTLDVLPTVAGSESTVLIVGESGTGKELLAQAIHNLSTRRNGPFVAVNCAGIPATLIEAELFGHEAGAFTGALKAREGRFRRAERGTLFLDEIGDLPLEIQAKLLRVLQERVYEPLGSSEAVAADVRIVAATNHDLSAMVNERGFREDLYYRINVIQLELPPLRERHGDIALLVEHFVAHFAAISGKDVVGVSPDVLNILVAHDYAGNVRELKNIIEHSVVLCQGTMIREEHLPRHLKQRAAGRVPKAASSGRLEDCERQMILSALEENDWNRLAAARRLGIHKTTLFRKIRRLGMKLPEIDGRSSRSVP